jgi:hypothetical protein
LRWKEDGEEKALEEGGEAVFEGVAGNVLSRLRKTMKLLG